MVVVGGGGGAGGVHLEVNKKSQQGWLFPLHYSLCEGGKTFLGEDQNSSVTEERHCTPAEPLQSAAAAYVKASLAHACTRSSHIKKRLKSMHDV